MKIKNKNVNRKRSQALTIVGALSILTLTLAACSSLGGLTSNDPEGVVRATWTPEVHPTDLPYRVESENISYFGDAPVVAIFGSADPADNSPLQAFNLSTEDEYAISALTPGPISTWSRPIMAENKNLYFQIGSQLYLLTPEGSTSVVGLPFDEGDPVLCNWSWQGQLVCLNALMTEGYLVDQDLNVVEMPLPAYTVTDESVDYYPPYRAGENTMRILQTQASWSGGLWTVHFRDLNLETHNVTSQQIQLNYNFGRTYAFGSGDYGAGYASPEADIYTQSDEALVVLGMTDDGQKILIQSALERWDDLGELISVRDWVEVYDKSTETPTHVETPFNLNDLDNHNHIYQNHLITNWRYNEGRTRFPIWPGVFDLETGELLFNTFDVYGTADYYTEIQPYGEDWLLKSFYGVGFLNQHGIYFTTYNFPAELANAFEDATYKLTQPMEP